MTMSPIRSTWRLPKEHRSQSRAFTLLELVVVMLIVGLISVIGVISYTQLISGSKTTAAQSTAGSVARAANVEAANAAKDTTTAAEILVALKKLPNATANDTAGTGTFSSDPSNNTWAASPTLAGRTGYKISQNGADYYVCIVSGQALARTTACT